MANVDKEKVEKQAKDILDKFALALEKVEKEHEEDTYVDRDEFERSEISQLNKSNEDSKNSRKFKNCYWCR
ncbi:Uncharacterised protein [uncultured archaeon]|nr:Uncharacterised protein [uncultured archaeon]